MGMSTERLEVRVPSPTLQLLRQEARRRGVAVAELVREAISLLLDQERRARERAAESLFRIEAPAADWEEMKQEISAAYSSARLNE